MQFKKPFYFVQQKVFKLKGKYFVEGQGERITENDQVMFKNMDDLQFDDAVRLNQIVCE